MRGGGLVLLALLSPMAGHPVQAQPPAQRQVAARALDLERSGNYAGAINAYRAVLAEAPGHTAALLGLERSLTALGRLPEILGDLAPALAADSTSAMLLGLTVRAWVAAGEPDQVAAVADRWSRMAPGSETPWQEWGMAAVARQDYQQARRAFAAGRARLGRPDALSVEIAQLASIEGNYAVAVPEWIASLERLPTYRSGAVALLGQAPPERRPEVLEQLSGHNTPVAARLAALLMARWGDPEGGLDQLLAALPREPAGQREELEVFLDGIAGMPAPRGRIVEGRVYERLAAIAEPSEAVRHWLDAAQAYSDAGDTPAARRMLGRLASAGGVPRAVTGAATLTLVGVLVDEGRLDEAQEQFEELRGALAADDRERLARRVASGWLRAGDLTSAAALAAADSSLEGLDLAGRIQLYRGDLAGAADLLRMAGPYAGTRDEASARLVLLALLQVVARDSLPGLGRALFTLERGDSLGAAGTLAEVAGGLPADGGGAELRLLAGRLLAEQGRHHEAEPLLERVAADSVPAAAAAALLELARIEARTGRAEAAGRRLERLILAWPASAVAPEARRLLDQVHGRTPGAR